MSEGTVTWTDRQRQDRTGILVTKIRCDNVPQILVALFTPPSTVSGREDAPIQWIHPV